MKNIIGMVFMAVIIVSADVMAIWALMASVI